MTDRTYTHVYGIAGIIPGITGLVLAWGIPSPWSEYALMASGWLAACIYALLLWKIANQSNAQARIYGEASKAYTQLEQELERIRLEHSHEMEHRAKIMEFLAGMSMGQSATPRSPSAKEQENATRHPA